MPLQMEDKPVSEFLKATKIINYKDSRVKFVAEWLIGRMMNTAADEAATEVGEGFLDPEIELVRLTYEYVRDRIANTADIASARVTVKASDVLNFREGSSLSKVNLLAALLRCNGIATGFCYQYICPDENASPRRLMLHPLVAVYIESLGQWIRLDARGNKPGIHATFSLTSEHLAYAIRPELGETDLPMIYSDPNEGVIKALTTSPLFADLTEKWPETLVGH